MDYGVALNEMQHIINQLDKAMDSLEYIDQNNAEIDFISIGEDLKIAIDTLDMIIKNMGRSNDKSMLESARDSIEEIKYNLNDSKGISVKIEELETAKGAIIDIKTRIDLRGRL